MLLASHHFSFMLLWHLFCDYSFHRVQQDVASVHGVQFVKKESSH